MIEPSLGVVNTFPEIAEMEYTVCDSESNKLVRKRLASPLWPMTKFYANPESQLASLHSFDMSKSSSCANLY
jgi:hypothetical protein